MAGIQSVSILIASYNTSPSFVDECLSSIQEQQGTFLMELVWINDGSDEEHTKHLENALSKFRPNMDFQVKYKKNDKNRGLSSSLHDGVLFCSNELIFRMDSDDIMLPTRIQKQLDFMTKTKSCMMCGTNMYSFIESANGQKTRVDESRHPFLLTWNEYKKHKKSWILNHPTLCFRKSAVLEVGNYTKDFPWPFEDLDLELRILKLYGNVCTLPDILLYYRIHNNQITQLNKGNHEITKKRDEYIENMVKN